MENDLDAEERVTGCETHRNERTYTPFPTQVVEVVYDDSQTRHSLTTRTRKTIS